MTARPRISIIIPVHNRPEEFYHSYESALWQTYRPIEIIVIDDGSEPALPLVLAAHAAAEMNVEFRSEYQENRGAPAARNRGFARSRGEYVIFWDADIIARPEMLEQLYTALARHEAAGYSYCNYQLGRKNMPAGDFSPERLRDHNYIAMASLLRRAAFPGFDETLRRFQDWDLWLTLLERGYEGVWVDQYLYTALAGGSMSQWLPRLAYKTPWRWLPGVRGRVKAYEQGREVVRRKHGLSPL